MNDKMIAANGIEIRTESFGDSHGTPLLLVMGASAPGVYWPERFIQHFVDAGCFVIRYDNRDTGRTTCREFAAHPYTLDDMAKDAVAVMDGYNLQTAHVAGASMGGMIVQTLAIQHRARLRSATIIMSTPLAGGGDPAALSTEELPGADQAWTEKMMALAMQPSGGRDDDIERKIKQFELLAGSIEAFDEDEQRRIATIEVDQANDLNMAMNHSMAIASSHPADRRPLLAELDLPTLVIHGTEDPILPYPHGVAIAETIPNAELLTLERAGHEMPKCYEQEMVSRMLALQTQAAN
ncbi:MAG: alpha/beta hydrolase [Pseudomonadota bacterium]